MLKIGILLLLIIKVSSSVNLAYWLRKSEHKVYSQNGEDGLIETLIDVLEDATDQSIPKTFVEFGVQDGSECNTRLLREKRKFDGILMDGSFENAHINLYRHFITAENINSILTSLEAPTGSNLGILSIDLDLNDWYVWRSILEAHKYRPVIVIIEFNSSISPDDALVVPYMPSNAWDGSHFYGASLRALVLLGRRHGYALVACDSSGTNAFFIDTQWSGFQHLPRGGFSTLGLPSIHSAYVRAQYVGEQPPSTSAEHDAKLSLEMIVDDSRLLLNCPIQSWMNPIEEIEQCSELFANENVLLITSCDSEEGSSCVINLLSSALQSRRWVQVSEDGTLAE